MTMEHPDHPQPPPVPGRLLDSIENLMIEIENARQVPLSSSVMINQDEMLDELAGIQSSLPEELRAARSSSGREFCIPASSSSISSWLIITLFDKGT